MVPRPLAEELGRDESARSAISAASVGVRAGAQRSRGRDLPLAHSQGRGRSHRSRSSATSRRDTTWTASISITSGFPTTSSTTAPKRSTSSGPTCTSRMTRRRAPRVCVARPRTAAVLHGDVSAGLAGIPPRATHRAAHENPRDREEPPPARDAERRGVSRRGRRRPTGVFRTGAAGSRPGLLDAICPMAYTTDPALFRTQIANVEQLAGRRPVWAGIGAYQLSPAATVENIRAARQLGAEGIVLFSYDNLERQIRRDGRERGLRAVSDFARAADVVQRGVDERAFPAAVVEVGTRDGVLWQQAFGRLDYDADSARHATGHDFRSRVADESDRDDEPRDAAGRAAARSRLSDPIADWIPEWRGKDREHVTLRSLLTHSSGSDRMAPLLSRPHGTAGISARDLLAAARISARHAGDLQRSRFHPARVHHRRCRRRSVREQADAAVEHADIGAAAVQSACAAAPVDRADRARSVARATARRRGARRELLGARWSRRSCRVVRHGAGGRRFRARDAWRARTAPTHGSPAADDRPPVRDARRRLRRDRVRSDGTRCCRHLRAGRKCPRQRSVTQDLRGRRCGSIPSAKSTWCFSRIASIRRARTQRFSRYGRRCTTP